MSEEVDIFYARHNSKKLSGIITDIRPVIVESVEVLENMREGTDSYRQGIFNLYLLAMGKYETDLMQEKTVRERR